MVILPQWIGHGQGTALGTAALATGHRLAFLTRRATGHGPVLGPRSAFGAQKARANLQKKGGK